MLKVLRDTERADRRSGSRRSQALQAASFSVVAFESCRGDVPRDAQERRDRPDPELRQRVLGILAREKDGFAQEKLLEGLEDPDKALVPPEKALQLLSYDVHAEAYPVGARDREQAAERRRPSARRCGCSRPTPRRRRSSRSCCATRRRPPAIGRIVGVGAARPIAPQVLQTHAREIVLDASESDEMQATSLTALTQFGDTAAVSADKALRKRIGTLKKSGRSKNLKDSAGRFLDKYGE